MGELQLKNMTIGYNNQVVLANLNLTVNDGEILSLLGPSGVGKTTLLKTIAGLTPPIEGNIAIEGKDITHVPANKRDTVLLFQKPLLFPFLSVLDNIGFGLRMQRMDPQQIKAKTVAVMERTEISDLGAKKTDELSGGQQQRVALARALVLEPSILLMDEPFSSLDADLRQKMQALLRTLQQETGITMLFVTHDQSEAFSISDRIALLIDKKIEQIDTPERLFTFPKTPNVAHFFGNPNIISGHISDNILFSQDLDFPVLHPNTTHITATIRPENISISQQHTQYSSKATVLDKRFEGVCTRLTVQLRSRIFTVISLSSDFQSGQQVWIHFPPEKIHFIPSQ
ncbi:MAG: spermidine/putrescine ABC transporter ATP-binding protein [Desulfotalea sp.]|nr:MAG: spermidine/putrescine ABC transporter ATP-binding protein [Desulfotalea sp.]